MIGWPLAFDPPEIGVVVYTLLSIGAVLAIIELVKDGALGAGRAFVLLMVANWISALAYVHLAGDVVDEP